MNTLSISIDDNFIIINTIEFYCVIFKNLKIDGSLFGVVANVPKNTHSATKELNYGNLQ